MSHKNAKQNWTAKSAIKPNTHTRICDQINK